MLVRCDSAGATHLLTDTASELELRFSVGFDAPNLSEPRSCAPPSRPGRQRSQPTGSRAKALESPSSRKVWLELVLMALDLVAWTQALLLDGALATAEPKTLRYRLRHVAGQITRHARRTRLHIPAAWPWTPSLLVAARRLDALPAP